MQEKPTQVTTESAATQPTPLKTNNTTTHASNPFTTTLRGIKKLFQLNTGPFIGTTLFTILISILGFLSISAVIIGALALTIKNSPEDSVFLLQFPLDTITFYKSISEPTIFVSFVLGTVLFVGFAALSQAMPLYLLIRSSENQRTGFSEVFKQSIRRLLPFIGLFLLISLVTLATSLLLILLSQVLGILTIVFAIAAFVAWIYLNIRFTFAAFSVLTEQQGPITALKRSWALTKGRFAETIGVVGAALALGMAVLVIFELLLKATESIPVLATIITILLLFCSFIVGIIVVAGLTERFIQLKHLAEGTTTPTKTHPANYIAFIVAIALIIISSMIAPQSPAQTQQQPGSFNDAELEQLLEEYRKSNPEGLESQETIPESESQFPSSYDDTAPSADAPRQSAPQYIN